MTRDTIWQEFNRRMGQLEGEADHVREREQRIAESWFADMMDHEQSERTMREQTAATILASLIRAHATANSGTPYAAGPADKYASDAVKWADALRAALRGGE